MAFCHLRGITLIRRCLTIVKVLVMLRLDTGNAMVYRLPETQLRKLQMVQNSAARLIAGTKRRDHITHVMYCLHWLSVHTSCTVYTGCLYIHPVLSTLAVCTPADCIKITTPCLPRCAPSRPYILSIARDPLHADQITSIDRTRSTDGP